jgi:hypothetical protein
MTAVADTGTRGAAVAVIERDPDAVAEATALAATETVSVAAALEPG